MKTSSISISLASFILSANALVRSSWSVTNVPSTGLTDVTFPLTIVEADHFSGYFLAQQFSFVNSGMGYTGLQPRPDANGKTILHAAFLSFIAGSNTTDKNCFDGADGGPGVSCNVEWNGVYGRRYDLEVKSNGSSVWVGTVIDTVTGARIHIGSYTLPASAGGIQSSHVGFVEWFFWNIEVPENHCALLPYQRTIFGTPHTTHPLSSGFQSTSVEYGDCVGKVAFHTQKVLGGAENNCGFKGMTGWDEHASFNWWRKMVQFVPALRGI
ncbi:Beta-glucan synthesis-associated [Mycena sanguinolenta]|uniref:Beta-glucan synthesis-associated n=1 Tax=Mycena sanguinolenta TaxID=230812 RepID=A0A8H6ZG90_9AGAR|nr:Beta-glucan synthesis-associated [Mycena sanguinolenta]